MPRPARRGCASSIEGGGEIEVGIEDDGIGIASPSNVFHYGLSIMRERAHGLHGEISIGNRPQGGTKVSLRFHAQLSAAPNQPTPDMP
jgi:two-component system nitrate/nitrite sensor histidine kinase NarX